MTSPQRTGRLKVLVVTAWFPTAASPIFGIAVRDHASAVQLYDDVVVLHLAGLDPQPRAWWRLEQERDEHLTAGLETYRLWHGRFRLPRTTYFLYVWSVVQAVRRLAAGGFAPDVLHAHVYEAGVPAVVAGRLLRRPVVVSEHFSAFPRRELPSRELWKARLAFAGAARVLPVSRALQDAITGFGLRGRFQVIPNPVDLDTFHPPRAPAPRPDGVKRILFVGRLVPVKAVPALLRAAAALDMPGGSWRLEIVGDGPDRSQVERLAATLGLSDRVTFHGRLARSRVADLMRDADVLALPSEWENLPCAALEAMACGLPVVASRVGGIPELIDEGTGILVPPGDPAALAAALASVLAAGDRFDRTAIAARARQYGRAEIGRALHGVYMECIRA